MPPRARRHHAIEHVDAARDRGQHVVRRAHAHQVAGTILRQLGGRHRHHVEHGVLPLANREPADGVAVETDGERAPPRSARGGRYRRCPARCRTGLALARRWPANARFDRSAQRSDSSMEDAACSREAGNGVHSSSTIWISAPSRHWISIARSGVSKCVAPSRCDWKVTPCSSIGGAWRATSPGSRPNR